MNQFPNVWQGQIRPLKKHYRQPPCYQDQIIIGQAGQYFGKLKIWQHSPSFEFPTSKTFLSLTAGNGSAFTHLDPQDIDNLIKFLVHAKGVIQANEPILKQSEAIIEQQLRQAQNSLPNIPRQPRYNNEDFDGDLGDFV